MKDPAILFYTGDFLTGTMTMTDEQVGKYIRLLCLQHQKGRLTEKDMLFICKSYDEDIFIKFEKNGDGRYFNRRLEEEITKRSKYSESRSNNRKNKEKKELEPPLQLKHMNNICETYDNHMENEDEDININVLKEGGTGETIDFSKTVDYWNTFSWFVKITDITETRKKKILYLISTYGKEDFKIAIDNAIHSKYLNGKNKRRWKMTFDWLLNPENFVKVLEGNFNDDHIAEKRQNVYA